MTILKIKKFSIALMDSARTQHNWYKKTVLNNEFSPNVTVYSFGFIWLGRIVFYIEE